MQIGKKIRDLRLRRGLTVQQLAEATGLSKGFISQVENNRTSPSLATLQDLARALETSVAYLVVEEDRVPHVVRAAERPRLQIGGNNGLGVILRGAPGQAEFLGGPKAQQLVPPRGNLEGGFLVVLEFAFESFFAVAEGRHGAC